MGQFLADEEKTVREIIAGNETALRRFYHAYHLPLTRFVRQKVENEKDVEEIVQDTFFGAIEAFRDFSFRSSLFTFLCSIAIHKVIDFYRKKKMKNIVFSRLPEIEEIIGTMLGPEDALDKQLVKEKIKATFARLTPQYQIILRLKYVYGYSVEEIARKLSISFKSAESQLFRARKAFEYVYSL